MHYTCAKYVNKIQKSGFAEVSEQWKIQVAHTLGKIPANSEMRKIGLFDSLPDELTYPILRDYFEIAVQKK